MGAYEIDGSAKPILQRHPRLPPENLQGEAIVGNQFENFAFSGRIRSASCSIGLSFMPMSARIVSANQPTENVFPVPRLMVLPWTSGTVAQQGSLRPYR